MLFRVERRVGSEKPEQTRNSVDRLDTQVTSLHHHVATLSQEVRMDIYLQKINHIICHIIENLNYRCSTFCTISFQQS